MLPKYDKSKRKSNTFEQLPKGAYVIKIMGAKEDTWPSGDKVLKIAFDIAEGKYKDFYQAMFERNTNEDKQWPYDAVFNLNVPADNSQPYVWDTATSRNSKARSSAESSTTSRPPRTATYTTTSS